ncbi:MAG: hypothetical protein MUO82_10270 [Candidatus Thermoplasmatota archaeon]|nr:hypothetical protein [Candidatus Thermoplasmatota archaeon]
MNEPVIEEAGGENTYDQMVRKQRKAQMPKLDIKLRKEIIFEELSSLHFFINQ